MQTKPNHTTPTPKSDAQPVQAAIPARPKLGAPASEWADYNAAISAAGIRFQDKLDADFVAKAQPVQAASTPGPWEKRDLRIQKGGNYIADCDVSYMLSDEEKHGNARLIAAAPDLLSALERCLPFVDSIRAMTGGDGDLTALTARAAIAAAKGETL